MRNRTLTPYVEWRDRLLRGLHDIEEGLSPSAARMDGSASEGMLEALRSIREVAIAGLLQSRDYESPHLAAHFNDIATWAEGALAGNEQIEVGSSPLPARHRRSSFDFFARARDSSGPARRS